MRNMCLLFDFGVKCFPTNGWQGFDYMGIAFYQS